jgi:hypothetical protein
MGTWLTVPTFFACQHLATPELAKNRQVLSSWQGKLAANQLAVNQLAANILVF